MRDKDLCLGFSHISSHNPNKKLLTVFQHCNHGSTCPSDWTCLPSLSWDQFNQ